MRYTNFSGWNVKTKLSSRKFRPESYLALTVHTSNMHFLFLWNRSYHIKSVHNLNWKLKSQIPKNQKLALANSRKDTLTKLFWLFSVLQFYHERINGDGKCASLTGICLLNGGKQQQQQIGHATHIGEPRCANANWVLPVWTLFCISAQSRNAFNDKQYFPKSPSIRETPCRAACILDSVGQYFYNGMVQWQESVNNYVLLKAYTQRTRAVTVPGTGVRTELLGSTVATWLS